MWEFSNIQLNVRVDEALAGEDFIVASGIYDGAILFDKALPGLSPAPISTVPVEISQHVHLCGFADGKSFVVGGTVLHSSETEGIFHLSCPTLPGLGSAVVCNDTGHVVGYCGGACVRSDGSLFGAYAYRVSPILTLLRNAKSASLTISPPNLWASSKEGKKVTNVTGK